MVSAVSISFSSRIKGSHPLSPHACLPPPESSLLVPAVATVRSGFLGNCCHGDPVLSYWANASHLYPYLVCDRNAGKTVRLKVLHLFSFAMQVGLPGPKLLGSLYPIPAFFKVPGQLLPMESKSWTAEDKEICSPWVEM